MADLTQFLPDDRERGQLILIAAFILAVSFVVLAIVVNSAIFTENLATRDDVAGSQDALEHRYEVTQSIGELLRVANNDTSINHTHVEESVENVSAQGGVQQSSLGRIVNLSYSGNETGLRIFQEDQTRNFRSNGTETQPPQNDWNLTTEDEFAVRNFEINVTDSTTLVDSDPFRVVANHTGDPAVEWSLTISRHDSGDGIEVEVEHTTQGPESCTRDDVGDHTVVDVTGGTVEGEPCTALTELQNGTDMWFGTGVNDPFRIEYENGDNIQGTYSFIVNDTSVDSGLNVDNHPDDSEPHDAIYSVDVSYTYYTPSVGYETEIRVAPGEVPDD